MSEKRTATGSRTIFPHSTLMTGARFFLEQGKSEHDGSFYMFMSSMLFSALVLEAYLNYLGSIVFERSWSEVEWKLTPKAKLELIAERVGLNLDPSKPPMQTIPDIIRFRNDISHTKFPGEEVFDNQVMDGHDLDLPYPSKLKYWAWCEDSTKAEIFIRDVEIMARKLHKQADKAIQDIDLPPFSMAIAESAAYWVHTEDD